MKLQHSPTHTHTQIDLSANAHTNPFSPVLRHANLTYRLQITATKKATHKLCLLCMHYASARVGNPAESYLCQYQPNLALWSTHSFSNASG